MTLSNSEIDSLAGLKPEGKSTSTPLLTSQQKSEMLDPPAPWYAQKRAQIGIVAAIVILPGWLLYTLFSDNGSEQNKVF